MKIKISKILLVLSVCGLLYSCDKFFEVDLKEQMDEDKYDGVHPVLISECGNQNAAQLLHHGIEAKWPGAPVKIVPCSGLCSFYAQDQGIIITY